GAYSATIAITDSGGVTLSLTGTVAQIGDSAQYTVTAPDFTLPEEGTYQVAVTVTDSDGATPISVTGTSTAVIADALLSPADPQPTLTVTEGIGTGLVPVSTFTDANPGAPATDFTAVIDWGDGSPTSLGQVTGRGGVFTVPGSHTYVEESANLIPATYTIVVNIVDDGGSRLTTTTTASVTDATLAANPTQPTVDAVEGQPFANVPVSYFIDTNELGTVSDFSVSIAWGANAKVATTLAIVHLIGHTPPGAPVSGIIFQVLGSNTYTDEGSSTITV